MGNEKSQSSQPSQPSAQNNNQLSNQNNPLPQPQAQYEQNAFVPQLQQQYQPQNQQQQQMPYLQQSYGVSNTIRSASGFRLIDFAENKQKKEKNTKNKLAAVIITICDGETYDALFTSIKQEAGKGSRVSVYSCTKFDIKDLIKYLSEYREKKKLNIKNIERKDDLTSLLTDLLDIEDNSCVAINYECCSECDDDGFRNHPNQSIINELIFFLECGYLVMYSDFSLKAIINAWNNYSNNKSNENPLGPNPFIRTGTWSSSVTLNFNPDILKTCISSQLQSVGELCPDQNYCTVHCMGGTVKYSVQPKIIKIMDDLPFSLNILTIAKFDKHENSCAIQVPDFESVNQNKDKKKNNNKNNKKDKDENKEGFKYPMKTLYGDAGHVVLDYSDRQNNELCGKVLLSMTHWCELVKLGDSVNDEVLFQVAAKNLGVESDMYQNMKATYDSYGGKNATGNQLRAQKKWITKTANMMVQQQAPCNNTMNSNISYTTKSSYWK